MVSALTLLLVFWTEASYEWYVEGRKAWMRVLVGRAEGEGIGRDRTFNMKGNLVILDKIKCLFSM